MLGPIINEKIDELIERQTSHPIRLREGELKVLAVRYGEGVRRAAGHLAAELTQAVGRRQGLGGKQRGWIKRLVRGFVRQKTSLNVLVALLDKITSGKFEIANAREAEQTLSEAISGLAESGLLMKVAEEELNHAKAVFGKGNTEQPTPGEKAADPERHPTITVKEARMLFHCARSTIYRRLNEGKLKRASLGRKAGRRGQALILTKSAAKLLEEDAE